MRLTTGAFGICAADHRSILVVGIQNVVRDIKIGMVSRITLMLLHLLLSRMHLRHGIETGLARRGLLHSEYRKHAVELFTCAAALLGPGTDDADRDNRHRRSRHGRIAAHHGTACQLQDVTSDGHIASGSRL